MVSRPAYHLRKEFIGFRQGKNAAFDRMNENSQCTTDFNSKCIRITTGSLIIRQKSPMTTRSDSQGDGFSTMKFRRNTVITRELFFSLKMDKMQPAIRMERKDMIINVRQKCIALFKTILRFFIDSFRNIDRPI